MESMSISELISSLKTAFKSSEYDAVAKVLIQRDEQQQQIIEALKQDAETRANEKPPAASIDRELTVEEIYERLLLDDIIKCSKEENERLKKENQRLKQQNEVLCAENQTLQQQDEALCACVEELERRIADLDKGINSFKKDVVRAQEKDGGRQNSTVKLRRVLEFDDVVYSSAARNTNIKQKEAIPGEVVEIVDSDDECVVPRKGNQSAQTNTNKRVQQESDSSIDLSHDHDTTNKDHDIAGRKKIRTENSTDVGDLHISSRNCLNDSGVLEKCQMLNVNESTPLLIKSQSTYSSPDSQNTKFNPRDASSARKGKLWKFEGELVADLTRNDILCMEAVCALHKHRISVEESLKNTGGPKLDQLRGTTRLAEVLTAGDPDQRLNGPVAELAKQERHLVTKCREIAVDFSKELFELYGKHEDLFASKS